MVVLNGNESDQTRELTNRARGYVESETTSPYRYLICWMLEHWTRFKINDFGHIDNCYIEYQYEQYKNGVLSFPSVKYYDEYR